MTQFERRVVVSVGIMLLLAFVAATIGHRMFAASASPSTACTSEPLAKPAATQWAKGDWHFDTRPLPVQVDIPLNREQRLDWLAAQPAMLDDAAAATIEQVARLDLDPEVRRAALEALADRTAGQTANVFRDALLDANAKVRTAAMRGLTRYGNAADVDALAGVLRGTDQRARLQALGVLSALRNSEPVVRSAVEGLFLETVNDLDPLVRETAADLLAERTARLTGH